MASDGQLRRLGRLLYGDTADELSSYELARRLSRDTGGGTTGSFLESLDLTHEVPTSYTDVASEAVLLGFGDNVFARDAEELAKMRENIRATLDLNPVSGTITQILAGAPASAALMLATGGAAGAAGAGLLGRSMVAGAAEGALAFPGFADEEGGLDDALLGAVIGGGLPLLGPAARAIGRAGRRATGAVRGRFGRPQPPPPEPVTQFSPGPGAPPRAATGVVDDTVVDPTGLGPADTTVDPTGFSDLGPVPDMRTGASFGGRDPSSINLNDFLDAMEAPTPTRTFADGPPAAMPDTQVGGLPAGISDTVVDAPALPARAGGPAPPMRTMGPDTQGLFDIGAIEAPPRPPSFDPSPLSAAQRRSLEAIEPLGERRAPRLGVYGQDFRMPRPRGAGDTGVFVRYGDETMAMVRARDFFRNHKIGRPAGAGPNAPRQWVTREGNVPALRVPEGVAEGAPRFTTPGGRTFSAKQLRTFEPDMSARARAAGQRKMSKYEQAELLGYQNKVRAYERRIERWERRLAEVRAETSAERARRADFDDRARAYSARQEDIRQAREQLAFLQESPVGGFADMEAFRPLADPVIREKISERGMRAFRRAAQGERVELRGKLQQEMREQLRQAEEAKLKEIDKQLARLRRENASQARIRSVEGERDIVKGNIRQLIEAVDDNLKNVFMMGPAWKAKLGIRGARVAGDLMDFLRRPGMTAEEQTLAVRGMEAIADLEAARRRATERALGPIEGIARQSDIDAIIDYTMKDKLDLAGKRAAAKAVVEDLMPMSRLQATLGEDPLGTLGPMSLEKQDAQMLATLRRLTRESIDKAKTPEKVDEALRRAIELMGELPSRKATEEARDRMSGFVMRAYDAAVDPGNDMAWQVLKEELAEFVQRLDPMIQDMIDLDVYLARLDEIRMLRQVAES